VSRKKPQPKAITPRVAKATNAEIAKRVNVIFKLLISGASRADILQYAAETAKWQIEERQIDEYIARATEQIEAQAETVRTREFGRALAFLAQLKFKNMLINDFKAALATQREINELLGLYPVKQHALTIDWRSELRQAGIPEEGIAAVFEEMVSNIAEHLTSD
jgi:hypothetical protein